MNPTTNSLLIDEAMKYLKSIAVSKNKLKQVAKEAGLTESWMYKFYEGKIKSPSVQKIEKILSQGGYSINVLKELQSDKDLH
ncbi:hypothetical protein [Pseudoalteromonas tetraodonis]|uniref:hypothetical protein n=1 Tax=Pseudoalteromonas tetraodonis TaxID=43659 RepID=UPI003002469E